MGYGEATDGSVVWAGLLSPFLALPYRNPRLQEASLRCVAYGPRKYGLVAMASPGGSVLFIPDSSHGRCCPGTLVGHGAEMGA